MMISKRNLVFQGLIFRFHGKNLRGILVCMVPVLTLSQSKFLREIPQRRCVFLSNSCVRLLLAETKLGVFGRNVLDIVCHFLHFGDLIFLKNNDNNQPTKKPKQAGEQPDKTKQNIQNKKKQTNDNDLDNKQRQPQLRPRPQPTNKPTNKPTNHSTTNNMNVTVKLLVDNSRFEHIFSRRFPKYFGRKKQEASLWPKLTTDHETSWEVQIPLKLHEEMFFPDKNGSNTQPCSTENETFGTHCSCMECLPTFGLNLYIKHM